jgi:WD40 repeat protein
MARYRLALGWLCVLFVPALVAGQAPPNKDQYGDPLPPGALARLGTLRWRHEAAIGFAAFLPGGKSVLSVDADQNIHIWEFSSGKEIRRITLATEDTRPGLRRPLLFYRPAVGLSTDGKVIATFFADSNPLRIRLHDIASGKELRSLQADKLGVKKLFFSTSRDRLLSLDLDGLVRVWDWANAKELRTFLAPGGGDGSMVLNDEEESLVLSPDGNTLMHMGQANYPNIGGPRFIRNTNALGFIDVNTGKEIGPTGESTPLVSIQFTADGKQLITQADDASTRRWDAGTGKELGSVKLPPDLPKGPIRQVRNVVVSPDGQIIATVSRPVAGASLNLIDANSDKNLSTLALATRGPGQPKTLLFGPGNKLLAVNHPGRPLGLQAKDANRPTIELFDIAAGILLHTFTSTSDAPNKPNLVGARPQTMLFSPNGKTLAWSVDGKTLSFWDIVSGQNTYSLTLPSNVTVDGASFTPDGRCLAMQTNGGGAMLFELAAGASRRLYGKSDPSKITGPIPFMGGGFGVISIKPSPSSHIAVSPSGKSLALAGPDKVLRVWDIDTGTELAAFQNAGVKLTAVAFSPDNTTLASTCADTTALVWDLAQTKSQPGAVPTRKVDVEECWQALAGNDGDKAFRASCNMSAMPKETLAFFKDRLQPAAKVDSTRARELIALLDHDQYKVREKAISELNKMGEQIVPALDKALAGNPTLESKLRLQDIRGRMTARPLHGDRLRLFRAVEVLERIGTPQSRQVLEALATGEPGVLLTTSAREALER